jgi:peptide/nickel transport system permease protein
MSTEVVAPVLPATAVRRRPARPATPVLVGAMIVGLLALAALLAPLIAPYDPNQVDFLHASEAPSWSHPMGTDDAGRDIFSRSLYGLRLDLAVVVFVTYLPLPIGVLLGSIAGSFGRAVDSTLARLADVMLAFPFFVLVIAIIAITGPGLTGVLIGVPLAGWAL